MFPGNKYFVDLKVMFWYNRNIEVFNMKLKNKILFTAAFAGGTVLVINNFLLKRNLRNAVIPEGFTLTAHTGCEGTRDNSLDAITLGFGCGADIVEIDLNFNSNGIAVLSHNEPKGNEPTLDEAFALVAGYKGLRVNVDVKNTLDLKQVTDLAEKHGILDRIFFTGIMAEFVDAVKEQTPDMLFYYNKSIDKAKNKDASYIASLVEEVGNAGAAGLNIHHKSCTKEMVDAFHKAGLELSVWTVNKKPDMARALKMGCDNITTRKPSELKSIIDSI